MPAKDQKPKPKRAAAARPKAPAPAAAPAHHTAKELRRDFHGHPFRNTASNQRLPAPKDGKEYDHKLELQVVAAAEDIRDERVRTGEAVRISAAARKDAQKALDRLLFTKREADGRGNVRAVSSEHNRAKGVATQHYLSGLPLSKAQAKMVADQKQHWTEWRVGLPKRVVAEAVAAKPAGAADKQYRAEVRAWASDVSRAVTGVLKPKTHAAA